MFDAKKIKIELEDQVEKIKDRIEILNMIEEKLFEIKHLAIRVINEDLSDDEIIKINLQVKEIKETIILLEAKSTNLS